MPTKEDKAYYNKVIISRFIPIYDMLMPIFAIVMLVVASVNYIGGTKDLFFVFRILAALTFFSFYFFRTKISIIIRVVSGSTIFMIIAFVRIYSEGISTVSLLILLIIEIASIVFLPKIYRYIFSGVIIFFLVSIFFQAIYKINQQKTDLIWMNSTLTEYVTTMIGFLLVTIMILLAFNHISNIHIEIIKKLENQIQITEEKSSQINQLAYYDSLTGLPNEELFQIQIEPLLPNETSTLVFVEIRDIEIIFSLQGSDIGEHILKNLGKEFSLLQAADVKVAHTFGNEFAIFFQSKGEEEIIDFVNKAIESFNSKYFNEIGFKKLRFYIAYVPVTLLDKNYHNLFDKAMITLRECKNNPQQKYIKYSSSLLEAAMEIDRIQVIVDKEIEENGFEIYYQEQVDSQREVVVGVEALARLKLENGQYISPNIFVPIIEKNNLAVPFGELIIRKVFQDILILEDKYGSDIMISINVSPTHLLSEGFANFLKLTAEQNGININNVTLEITEEVFIANANEVKDILFKLKEQSFKISLDDFGSGYSSLKYIAELPFDELKVDRSFTSQILKNSKTEKMVKVIFDMAEILNYHIVVEGVETKEELNMVKSFGNCDIQGFYFSKPCKLHYTRERA